MVRISQKYARASQFSCIFDKTNLPEYSFTGSTGIESLMFTTYSDRDVVSRVFRGVSQESDPEH